MIKRSLPLLVVLAGLLGACSGNDDSGNQIALEPTGTSIAHDEDPEGSGTGPAGDGSTDPAAEIPEITSEGRAGYIEALTLNLEDDPDNAVIFGEHAACVAAAWVDEIGEDRFAAAGVTPQMLAMQQSMDRILALDLGLVTATELMAHLPACGVDIVEAVLDSPVLEGADPDVRACVRDGLTEQMVLDSLAVAISGEGADSAEAVERQRPMTELMGGCGA